MPRENLDHSQNGRRSPPVVASETACLELGQELTCFVRDEIVRKIPTKKREPLPFRSRFGQVDKTERATTNRIDSFMKVCQTYANRISDQAGYIRDI